MTTEEATQAVEGPTVEHVVAKYLKLRNKKEQLTAEYKKDLAKIEENLKKLEAWLHIKMSVDKVNSFNTDAGSVFKVQTNQATVSNMEALLGYIRENEAWHLLEKRVSKLGVKELLEEGQPVPPGVNWYASTTVQVRKPNER